MYRTQVYGNIVLTTFVDEITFEDLEQFARDVNEIANAEEEIFMIALPINVKTHVRDLNKMRKTVESLRNVTSKATRLYGIRTNAMLSFISNIVSSLLGINTNMIECKSLEDMFKTIEKEAVLYPRLKESLMYLDDIKADLETVNRELVA